MRADRVPLPGCAWIVSIVWSMNMMSANFRSDHAEKDLLLRFSESRNTSTREEQCDDFVGARKLLLRYGDEGIAQWDAMLPMCEFQGVACSADGHVNRM